MNKRELSDRRRHICQCPMFQTKQLCNECHDDEQETVPLTGSNMLSRTNTSNDIGNDDEDVSAALHQQLSGSASPAPPCHTITDTLTTAV